MRISDWSSDVFSSDLRIRSARGVDKKMAAELVGEARPVAARYAGDAFVQRAMAEIEYDAENDAEAEAAADRARSEARRAGKEGDSTCRSRWSPEYSTKQQSNILRLHLTPITST